jgi:V-type H+-transporting ATPase subunit H
MTATSSDPQQLLRLAEHEEVVEFKILAAMPEWERFERSGILPLGSARLLSQLHGIDAAAVRIVVSSNQADIMNMFAQVLSSVVSEMAPAQYLLTLFSETCRTDASLWELLVKNASGLFVPFTMLLGRPNIDTFTADKAVQMLTAIMAHAPEGTFSIQQVKLVAMNLVAGQYRTSQVGVLDGLSNLLKHDSFRAPLFEVFGTLEKILSVSVETPSALYRSLFCLWVSSFNEDVLVRVLAPRSDAIVALLKSTFSDCRVEKVLRIGLSVVMNVVASPSFSEAMVESGIVHAIQPLEYEKWRDAELYDAIRNAANRVAAETSRHSNFERYEKELRAGTLRWGFIHSEKFWLENVNQFEKDNYSPVSQLVSLLASSDSVTQAVACHDLGEFARLHPSGKRVIAKLNGKNAVMALMTNGTREVSKEALLCTQKLMLNQWQKVGAPQTATKAK